jgi:hypothetical protein
MLKASSGFAYCLICETRCRDLLALRPEVTCCSAPGRTTFAPNQSSISGSAIPSFFMWHFIVSFDSVPRDRDLTVAVSDADGFHALEFPCRCNEDGCWIAVGSGRLLDIRPTHWWEHLAD